jgi:hypothetical protein
MYDMYGGSSVGDILKGLREPTWTITTFQGNLKTVNTDDYDIVPKKEKIERDLAAKEEEKKNLERIKEMELRRYDAQILNVNNEIEELKKQLGKKSK